MSPPRPTLAVGAVVLDEGRRLLVVRRRHDPAAGRWTLPGGRLEAGESLAEGVAREIAEETGLDVEVGTLVGLTEVRGEGHHYVILDFGAEVRGGELEAGDDADEVAWLTRRELTSVPTTDGLVEFLDEHGIPVAD